MDFQMEYPIQKLFGFLIPKEEFTAVFYKHFQHKTIQTDIEITVLLSLFRGHTTKNFKPLPENFDVQLVYIPPDDEVVFVYPKIRVIDVLIGKIPPPDMRPVLEWAERNGIKFENEEPVLHELPDYHTYL